jgi:aminoglycoside/choline kinase family phosphotransferase
VLGTSDSARPAGFPTALLETMGMPVVDVRPLSGDASTRCFFRCHTAAGETVVVAAYPPDHASDAARDARAQSWALRRGLPVPRLLGARGRVVVSEDLGDVKLDSLLMGDGRRACELTLDALAAFQGCAWEDAPTVPFDAAFFRHELHLFEEVALAGRRLPEEAGAFLDELCARLSQHPYRLLHRDFHTDNLLVHTGLVRVVDFQDLRGGPDTYDLVSLLRERGGGELIADEPRWVREAARRLSWTPGWERRYQECAVQRGLKVMGTFLRLAARGRPEYRRFLPVAHERAAAALTSLGAPASLLEAAARWRGDGGV